MKSSIFILLLLHCTIFLHAQPVSNHSALQLQDIMKGEKFVGFLPEDIHWAEDGSHLYFSWNPDQDTLRSLYKISKEGGTPSKLTEEELRIKPSQYGQYNKARTQKLYTKNGDIFLLDVASGEVVQITNTLEREYNPSFSGDETQVIYTHSNNLFAWNIATGSIRQLTDFKKGEKEKEEAKKDHESWLERDQLEYFEILRQRKATREAEERRAKSLEPRRPRSIYYGNHRINNIRISPDMRYVSYTIVKPAKGKNTKVPDFVTESGYLNDLSAREKVGTDQDTYELGIYDIERDSTYTIDTKQIPGIYEKPAFLKEYHQENEEWKDQYDHPREVAILGPVFHEDIATAGNQAAVVVRSLDNKDRWIMLLDMATGALQLIDRQHDEAWINGPGIGGFNLATGTLGWLVDNETLYFQSEETGYSHLYTYHIKRGEKKAMTSGTFEILEVDLSNDKRTFYIRSNKETPHQQHFYRMPVEGGSLSKITSLPGNHQVEPSPDEKNLAILYSFSNQPWELYVQNNTPGAKAERLTQSTTADFRAYRWREPQIVHFTASDGVQVPARLYRPSNPQPNGPAVIFVHGAGYLQNVHQWWSNYYREYMFHNLLADNGYTVLDIDYRGSAGYGRDWRTAIYRHMGGRDLEDQVDGAKYLAEQWQVHPDRIGIYGGSYGGFITLMALFTKPGVFKSGAALRSVTDWAHYNHPYTSNILNTPVEDSVAYFRSSPIYHAEGLEDQLLILHGMVDTNVQFQDVVRLAQRLIELGKENWEFAVFPLEGHGFVESSSWTDEYRRIFKLFQTTLRE